jgi:flagellar protein FliJ
MKPFLLDAVLKYRQQLEDKAVTQLSQAQRVLLQKKNEKLELNRQRNALLNKLSTLQTAGINIEDLLQYEHHLLWLEQERTTKEAELKTAIRAVEQKRNIVVERSREKKALEKLKQKQNQAYKRYLEKKEAAQLDEIAVLSHDRRNH